MNGFHLFSLTSSPSPSSSSEAKKSVTLTLSLPVWSWPVGWLAYVDTLTNGWTPNWDEAHKK